MAASSSSACSSPLRDSIPSPLCSSASPLPSAFFPLRFPPFSSRLGHRQSLLLITFALLIIPFLHFVPSVEGAQPSSNQLDTNSIQQQLSVYDNEIISEPEIECGPGIVRFNVNTRKGNASAVYVRGQSQNEDCTFHNTRNITIELAKCNVRRKREVNPNPGIAYQMTVVVQLHPLFVTRVDRAYNVNCFYREQRQDVSVDFGVNELVTQQVMSHAIIPNCTYSVHRDSPNGPRVKYTHVGEQLYHVWSCPSNMYAMLLYNCSAVDGKGQEYPIIDTSGCSRDEFLMPQITYTEDRTRAMTASSAFNFPDRNMMLFTCKIKLCMLKDDDCTTLTPPSCNGKRAKSAANGNFNVDNAGAEVGTGPAEKEEEEGKTTRGTSKTQNGGRASRTEVSGEVAERTNQSEEGGSSTKQPTVSSSTETTTASSTATITTTTPFSTVTTTTTAQTTDTTTASQSTTTTTVTPTTTASSTTTKTTTEEQLLSSVERAASWESSEGTQPKTVSPPPSSSSSASVESSTTAQTQSSPTADSTASEHKQNREQMTEDFPRPQLLLQNDNAKTEGPKKRMERMEKAEEGSWTISASEEGEEKGKNKVPGGEKEHFDGVTKPVQIFKKSKLEGTAPEESKAKQQLAAGRTQRDTPAGGSRAGGGRRRMAEVDFDIQSPELMILDDYEPTASAQKGSSQRSSVQEVPSFVDWENGQRAASSGRGVCFSPMALISAGALLLLLMTVVTVALFKMSRKGSAGSAVLEHSFYSH